MAGRKGIMASKAKAKAAPGAPQGGGVIISPNVERNRDFIDKDGNIVKPYSKEIIKAVGADDYIPTPEEIAAAQKKTGGETPAVASTASPIGSMLRDAIKAQIQGQIVEAMKEIDMGAMIKEAIADIFKPQA